MPVAKRTSRSKHSRALVELALNAFLAPDNEYAEDMIVWQDHACSVKAPVLNDLCGWLFIAGVFIIYTPLEYTNYNITIAVIQRLQFCVTKFH